MTLISCTSFEKKKLHHHIKTLASDDFLGRSPMSEGETKTLHYLEGQFNQMAIKPLLGLKGFRQPVPLASITTEILGPVSISGLELSPVKDISLNSSTLKERIELNDIPVIFLGFGIAASEYDWDDYKNVDIKDKIVVTLVNDPGFYKPEYFRGKNMTYYGRWTYKFEEAKRRGALGALVIHENEAAGYGFHVVSNKSSNLRINDKGDGLTIQGWLSLDAAKQLFAKTGKNFDENKTAAINKTGAPIPLGTLSMRAKNTISFGNSSNICGYIEGTNTNEYTVISAHWDHLGSKSNEQGGKDIYRGAIDNGTGVAAIIELARHFSKHKPARNLLICSFTAEEQGLLGAQYFVESPPVPLKSIRGMLNFDCLNVGNEREDIIFYGPEENTLYPLLKEIAAVKKRVVLKDENASKGYFYRSDHFPFIQKKVPALLFMDIGVSNPEYLTKHYHQPSDAHNPNWKLDGMIADLEFFKLLIERM